MRSRRKLGLTSERKERMSEEIKREEELDEIPKLRTPAGSIAYAAAGIIGIFALAAAMLYIWTQVL